MISFAIENIKNLKIQKCTDVENFSQLLNNQINFINSSIQEELKKKINDTIEILDIYFKRDFNERKKELTEAKKFREELSKLQNELEDLFTNNLHIYEIIEKHKQIIIKSLKQQKSKFSKMLKNKKYDKILNNIKSECQNSLKQFNPELITQINNIEEESLKIYTKVNKNINLLIQGKNCHLKPVKSLKIEISKNLGNPKMDLSKELMNELVNSCEGLYNIWDRKGFKNWVYSLFSSENYLSNVTDMMIETFISKLKYLSNLIIDQCSSYKNKIK